jgi:hypothetical protein
MEQKLQQTMLDYKLELPKYDTDSTGFVGLKVCALGTDSLLVSLYAIIGGKSTKNNIVWIVKPCSLMGGYRLSD